MILSKTRWHANTLHVSGDAIKFPSSFCIDSFGNFIVSDRDDHKVEIISQDGTLIHTIGTGGMFDPGKLYSPRGVAIDNKGRIVVVGWGNNYKL